MSAAETENATAPARPPLRRRVRWWLDRARFPLRRTLLRSGWRRYERRLARRGSGTDSATAPPDQTPLPPRKLRVLTVASPDVDFFVWSGKLNFDLLTTMLGAVGIEPGRLGAVLDFGCGCGRIARWFQTLEGPRLHGCDYNPELVAWVDRNLDGVEARRNGLEPPLSYQAGGFELLYALSIFTHLPPELEQAWIAELARVVRPGGHLWLTFSGEAHLDRLSPAQRAAFERGEAVTQFGDLPGTNLCASFHPEAYVRGTLLAGLQIVGHVPGAPAGPGVGLTQDAYLVRVPGPEGC